MKNLKQLQQLANTDQIRKHRIAINLFSIPEKTAALLRLSKDELAALHLHVDQNNRNHFQKALLRDSFNYVALMDYLKALEVPHFNVFDIQTIDGKRIAECFLEGTSQTYSPYEPDDIRSQILRYILEHTGDINAKTGELGATLVQKSVLACNLGFFDLLVEHGADINLRSDAGPDCDEFAATQDTSEDGVFFQAYSAYRLTRALKGAPTSQKKRVLL